MDFNENVFIYSNWKIRFIDTVGISHSWVIEVSTSKKKIHNICTLNNAYRDLNFASENSMNV